MWARGSGIVLMLVLVHGPSYAQEGSQEAVRLFQESVVEYRAGRFQNAVDLLRRAYELQPDPTLLYNLGRALEGLGDEAGAIDGYSRYLEAQPNAQDRGALERRIETLRQRLAERQALQDERREQEERERLQREEREREPPSREGARSGPGALPWIVAAVGGAALAGGGVLGFLATEKGDDAEAADTQRAVQAGYDDARSLATGANICFVAGGVIAAVGIVWGVVGNVTAGPDQDVDEVRAGSRHVSWAPPAGLVVTW